MAGKWLEGFETHTNVSQLDRKYATRTGSVAVGAGRVFGNSGAPNAFVAVTPSFGLSTTFVIGFGLRITSQQAGLNANAQGLYLEKASNEQCHIEFLNNAGSFEIRIMRGSTQVAVTSSAFAYGIWHYFEVKLTVDTGTNGAYEVRQNEVSVLSGSSVNLANTGTSQADIFAFRFTSNVSTSVFFDDLYVLDTIGSRNADFRGDTAIEGILPNANGTTIQWANDAGAGSNFDNVDDPGNSAPDESGAGGTNSSGTVGNKDLYAMQDLAHVNGTIHFIQVGHQLGMAAAGSRQVHGRYRDDGGTEANFATYTVASTVFDEFVTVLDANPATSTDWDVNDINGGQFGQDVAT